MKKEENKEPKEAEEKAIGRRLEGKELISAALRRAISFLRSLEEIYRLDKEVVRKKIGIFKAALRELDNLK